PLIDARALEGYNPANPGWKDPLLTYRDALAMHAGLPGERSTVMYDVVAPLEPARRDMPVMSLRGTAVTHEFFGIVEAPFLHGQPWSENEDQAGADVVVLGHTLSETLFGGANPVGQRVRILGHDFQVVGVLKSWRVIPKYFRLGGSFETGREDDFFMPFHSAIRHETPTNGATACYRPREPGWQGLLGSDCTWVQLLAETRTAAGRADAQAWLDNYTSEQHKLGRFQRKVPNRLFDMVEWMEFHHVVSDDSRLAAWLAFGFLLLCLVNTVGLLLAKFSARAAEVGVRRALGASRRAIFAQCLTEAGVVGLAGGVAGLGLSFGALALIGMQSAEMQIIASMDWQMLLLTFVMALAAALLAGVLPTWRACQVTPALQLKSQ
ncbi:MAG: ABC transporter permease, partial [Massilia sp.]|nr:ABC transporter permease [Massilia sp.]